MSVSKYTTEDVRATQARGFAERQLLRTYAGGNTLCGALGAAYQLVRFSCRTRSPHDFASQSADSFALDLIQPYGHAHEDDDQRGHLHRSVPTFDIVARIRFR